MDLCASTTSRVQSTGIIGQDTMSKEPELQSLHTASIHILSDDCLLHVFSLYRPFLLGEDENESARLFGGVRGDGRIRRCWWHKPAHVCQRWRNVILGSAPYLGVSLFCTYGTPVAEMLAHLPPLPLAIDYTGHHGIVTTEDEEGAILALTQRDRVRCVRLGMAITSIQKLIATMDEEYPVLEYLIIMYSHRDRSSNFNLILPETLQAPHLRHLTLEDLALPMGPRFLTTAVGLVTLCLVMSEPSTYLHPYALFHWLSFMPRLETLAIFYYAAPYRAIDRQLVQMPITTPVTLPNLHHFMFTGVSIDLGALVYRLTTPRLERLQIIFIGSPVFSVPCLVQSMCKTDNLRFDSAKFSFDDMGVCVDVYPHGEAEMYALSIRILCQHLDWAVSFLAQFSSSLSQISSAVERLTLEHKVHGGHSQSSEEHDAVDHTEWHKLFRPFRNVKTLHIGNGLVEQLSRCLELEDGELPLELLPGLQDLTYSGSGNASDAFTSFIDARQNAAFPVTLIVELEKDDPSESGSGEAGSDLDT